MVSFDEIAFPFLPPPFLFRELSTPIPSPSIELSLSSPAGSSPFFLGRVADSSPPLCRFPKVHRPYTPVRWTAVILVGFSSGEQHVLHLLAPDSPLCPTRLGFVPPPCASSLQVVCERLGRLPPASTTLVGFFNFFVTWTKRSSLFDRACDERFLSSDELLFPSPQTHRLRRALLLGPLSRTFDVISTGCLFDGSRLSSPKARA